MFLNSLEKGVYNARLHLKMAPSFLGEVKCQANGDTVPHPTGCVRVGRKVTAERGVSKGMMVYLKTNITSSQDFLLR